MVFKHLNTIRCYRYVKNMVVLQCAFQKHEWVVSCLWFPRPKIKTQVLPLSRTLADRPNVFRIDLRYVWSERRSTWFRVWRKWLLSIFVSFSDSAERDRTRPNRVVRAVLVVVAVDFGCWRRSTRSVDTLRSVGRVGRKPWTSREAGFPDMWPVAV